MLPVIAEHIEIRPDACGGKPYISGHRIKVQHVVIWHERMRISPDEIVAQHPGLTLADVHAALTYYHDHRDQINTDIRADEEFVTQMQATAPPSLLQQKLARKHATDDSVSPG